MVYAMQSQVGPESPKIAWWKPPASHHSRVSEHVRGVFDRQALLVQKSNGWRTTGLV